MFVQYTAAYSGSPISGLSVVDVLLARGFDVTAVFAVPGPLEETYRRRGCAVAHLAQGQWLGGGNLRRRLRRWAREADTARRYVALFRRDRPDLVYVNTLVGLGAAAAARALGIPVIWHLRELFEDEGGEMHAPLGGRALARTLVRGLPSRIVCISRSVRDNVVGEAPTKKVRIVYNPLGEEAFAPAMETRQARAALAMPESAFVIGLPGTLRPVKGHEFFLDSAARLVRDQPDFFFAVSGELAGAYADRLLRRCEELGLSQCVRFVGAVADMRTFYSACDIACIPSRGEPFGRTVIEAFAQRRPVVATRTGGIPEAVEDGRTGLLVEYGDVPALVASIRRLRGDGVLRERLVEAAWREARDRFHVDRFRHDLDEVIDELRPGRVR